MRLLAVSVAASALLVTGLTSGPVSAETRATVPLPTVEQIPGSTIFTGALQDLGRLGYTEREFVVTPDSPQVYAYVGDSTDVTVTPAAESPQGEYRSRIIVRAPSDPADFNGRVLVEMMNTTTTIDLDVAWEQAHAYLVRDGWAYVGITVQQTGLNALKSFVRDRSRYADLGLNLMTPDAASDPASGSRDPSLAWDVTSQVGALIAQEGPESPLAGYDVESTYLTGQSQMAGYLVTYINAIQPRHRVYDGFLVAYRLTRATNLGFETPVDGMTPNTSASQAQRRIDGGGAPVINLQTESDPIGDPTGDDTSVWRDDADTDTDRFRLWEVAGSSHNDRWGAEQALGILSRDYGLPFAPACDWKAPMGINSLPVRYAWNASLEALALWHEEGVAPAIADRIERANGDVVRDARGNAVGGLRLPALDVPVASYGPASTGGIFCNLTGYQRPFIYSVMKGLYPTKAEYANTVRRAAKADVAAGFLLPEDALELSRLARRGPAKDAQTIRDY